MAKWVIHGSRVRDQVDELPTQFDFDVAISYASEEEGLAEDVFILLNGREFQAEMPPEPRFIFEKTTEARRLRVFFAKTLRHYWIGGDLLEETKHVFSGPASLFVVPILSSSYVQKKIPRHELKLALTEERKRQFVTVIRLLLDHVDPTELRLPKQKIYIPLRREGTHRSAELILDKVQQVYMMKSDIKQKTRWMPKLELPVYMPPQVSLTKWVAVLGANVTELLNQRLLPNHAPREYPRLCDWLERDLLKKLSRGRIRNPAFTEPSQRNGETLSVRIAFNWNPDKEPLDLGNLEWWEVLEIHESIKAQTVKE